jgi:tetratricopeptide (TPR) repeat protein
MASDQPGPARKPANGPAVSSGDSSIAPQSNPPQGTDPSPPGSYDLTLVPTTPSASDLTIAGPLSREGRALASIGSVVIEIGTVLGGRYEIQKLLGMGGMGAVYKAQDRELDRPVGLKVIRPDLASNPEILARFKRELILARQITHRNIIRIFDLNEADGIKFITMEYIDGEDLRGIFMREGKLAPEFAVDILIQVCQGLAAAHSENVIHRDLKPSNIMRDASGRVVVMDFGLARTMRSDGMTQTGLMIGTMEYMSPEQAMGVELDARSDLFALGLIFYEALSGDIPFKADSAIASLVKRTVESAKPLRDHDVSIPEGLSSIVSKCLEREPANRYASAEQIIEDVQAWKNLRPPVHAVDVKSPSVAVASPPSVSVPAAVAARRIPYKWIAATVLGIAAIGGGFAGWKAFGPKPIAKHAPVSVLVADFENHTGDPIFDGTLEPMFNTALEGASFVNAFNRGEARKLASQLPNHPEKKIDEQAARLIAASESIGAVITGSLSRRAEGYKISVEAMNGLSGNSIASAEATVATKDEVMLAIPKLAAPLRKALGDATPESAQLAESQGSFKVGSLEAAHLYGVGMEQQISGKLDDALKSFSKAVELDPDFGRAFSGMAASQRNLGHDAEAQNDFKLALAHVDRMTERERYRTRGAYYAFIGNYPKCIEEYSALVAQYTGDNIGHTNLAACYLHMRNMPKALDEARRAVELAPKGVLQRLNLSLLLTYNGDFAGGVKEGRELIRLNPDYDASYVTLADAQIGLGKFQDASETFHQLEKLGKSQTSLAALGLAEVAAYRGQYGEASRMLWSAADTDLTLKETDLAGDKLIALAVVELAAGQNRQAVDSAKRALANKSDANARFIAGRVFAEAGENARAQEMANGLKAETLVESQTYGKIIEGLIALQKKNAQPAIQTFSDANKALDTWIGHFDLGRAYLQAGQFIEANSEFDVCIKRRGESLELLDDGPTYAYLPAIFYYQGRALEGMKNRGFTEPLQTYITIRGDSKEDPLAVDALRIAGAAQ